MSDVGTYENKIDWVKGVLSHARLSTCHFAKLMG